MGLNVLCGARRVEHEKAYPDIDIIFTCDRPKEHDGPHRHHIGKHQYYSWPNTQSPSLIAPGLEK